MKLKVQHVFDATLLLSKIINEQRPMPQRGKFRLARMHGALLPEFNVINASRDALIMSYQTPTENGQWIVPEDKAQHFAAAWQEIAGQEIEVTVQPIALADLDFGSEADGSIESHELITLGELVSE